MARRSVHFIHEGKYAAEVPVELIEDETAWSPYLSPEDVRKLDAVRLALRRGDLAVETRPRIRTDARCGEIVTIRTGSSASAPKAATPAARKPALGLDPRVATGTPEDIVKASRQPAGTPASF